MESFRDKGNGSCTLLGEYLLFKLRSAILADGGTGWTGIGRMSFFAVAPLACSFGDLGPPPNNARLSTDELSPVTGRTAGDIDIGKFETGNPPLLVDCGCGGYGSTGNDSCAVSWCRPRSSSINEFINGVSVVISKRLDLRRLRL